MTDNNFLGTMNIKKLLWKLALPTVVAQLINMLYNIVDRIYIGHIRGTGALALTGVGVCMPLIIIVSAFAMLVGNGGAPRASIAMGKKDNDMAEKILANCFSLELLISAALTLLLLIFNRPVLMAFGASENTIGYATDYMNIYSLGTLFVQLTLCLNAFITAQGFTRISMISVLVGSIANILLDPLFIFAFGMGVKGAALATVISQLLSTLWVLNFFFRGKTVLKIRKKNMPIKGYMIRPALALGTATFVMQASESIIAIAFNRSLLVYGGDIAVGTMTILSSVMQFAMLPLSGIGQGAQPIISYNYGSGDLSRVKEAFRLLLISSVVYSMSLWSFLMITPKTAIRMFTSDKALVEFAVKPLRVYTAMLGLFGIQVACQFGFTSLGRAKESISVAVLRKIILLIPLIYIMPHIMKNQLMAVYTAEPIADFLSITFTAILFTVEFKKMLKNYQLRQDTSNPSFTG